MSNMIGVMSVPKAGTFYMMAVLQNLDYNTKPIQIRPAGSGYNWEDDVKVQTKKLSDSVVCGHVGPKQIPEDWKIIFMYRDLRQCCVSLARWCKSTRQWGYVPNVEGPRLVEYIMIKHTERYAKMVERVLPWLDNDSCCMFNYNDKKAELNKLSEYLNKPLGEVQDAHNLALRTSTRTSNKVRSTLDNNWSTKCEMIFNEYLGEYNERLEKAHSTA